MVVSTAIYRLDSKSELFSAFGFSKHRRLNRVGF